MKAKNIIILSLLSITAISLSSQFNGYFSNSIMINRDPEIKVPKNRYSPGTTYKNGDASTYYNGIDTSQSGTTLLSSLRSLNLSRRKKTIGYSTMGTSASSSPYIYTDYDPNTVSYDSKGQPYGSKILSFYSGKSTTSWNKEHVWPNSHGGGDGGNAGSPYPDADIFMPRPTISSENSNRGNSFYVEGKATQYDGWDPVTAFGVSGCYGGTSIRGECARIIFYCLTVNANLKLVASNKVSDGKSMGNLETLLKWNLENPVNQREKNRNEGGEYLQGNRNAFVDHPEYACMVWGNTNANTRAICGGQPIPPTPSGDKVTSITLNYTDFRLNPPDNNYSYYYIDLIPTINPSSALNKNVSWTSSNPVVATVTNYGQVQSHSLGTTIITCTALDGSGVSASCTITVAPAGGCGGSIIVTSSVLFIVASTGAVLITIRKKKNEENN